MHVGDRLDRVVEAVAALPAGTEDLVVLHPREGMFHAGADLAVFGIVLLLARQEGPPLAFAVRDDEPGVEVGTVTEHGHTLAPGGQAGVPPDVGVGPLSSSTA